MIINKIRLNEQLIDILFEDKKFNLKI